VAACPDLHSEWSLQGYFALYDRVTLDTNSAVHEYYVVREGSCAAPPGYRRVALPTQEFHLYRRTPRMMPAPRT
jgi:hypothetical protein